MPKHTFAPAAKTPEGASQDPAIDPSPAALASDPADEGDVVETIHIHERPQRPRITDIVAMAVSRHEHVGDTHHPEKHAALAALHTKLQELKDYVARVEHEFDHEVDEIVSFLKAAL